MGAKKEALLSTLKETVPVHIAIFTDSDSNSIAIPEPAITTPNIIPVIAKTNIFLVYPTSSNNK
jgi:hypothetical protein